MIPRPRCHYGPELYQAGELNAPGKKAKKAKPALKKATRRVAPKRKKQRAGKKKQRGPVHRRGAQRTESYANNQPLSDWWRWAPSSSTGLQRAMAPPAGGRGSKKKKQTGAKPKAARYYW